MDNTLLPLKRPIFVSIVIPVRNERHYIEQCVRSLIDQDYPKELYEIIIIDGLSDDGSKDIVQSLANCYSNIFLFDNQNIFTSFGLNIGISKSKGEIIIILGAHSYVETDFLKKIIKDFDRVDADCIGGPIKSIGETYTSKTISIAMSSPFGVGNAFFRYSTKAGYVDTVAFGVYKRDIFKKIGLFDEELIRNQDDEFNYRLRKAGGKIFLLPHIRSYYYNRSGLKKLSKQYFDYGYWKVRVLQKHPKMMKLRHFIPGLFVSSILMSILLSCYNSFFSNILIFIAICYAIVNLCFSLALSLKKGFRYFPLLILSFVILHLSYGIGFLIGLIKFYKRWFILRETEPLKLT